MNKPIRTIAIFCLLLFVALMINATYLQYFAAGRYHDDARNRRVVDAEFSRNRGAILVGRDPIAESVHSGDRFDYQRSYPKPFMYAGLTGYFGYGGAVTGLERSQNDVLSGEDSRLFVNRILDLLDNKGPKGGDVELTINARAQQAAWDAVNALPGNNVQASVVALEPSTGKILAMVTTPTFDPNKLASHDFAANQRAYERLSADDAQPLLNRAVQTTLPPGSTFKILTAAAAIETGKYDASSTVPGGSSYQLPLTSGESGRIDNEGRACGSSAGVRFTQAMENSCNTTFAQLAIEVGADKMLETAEKFGFNSTWFDELQSTSGRSLLAESTFPEEMDKAQTGQAGFGQFEVRATPLQMAMVASGIANNGVVMRPYLVNEVQSPDSDVVATNDPEELSTAISPHTAGEVTKLMVATVNDGTASAAAIPGIQVAGKTGTAQSGQEDVAPYAWFTSFAPAKNAKVAVAVMIQNADIPRDDIAGGKWGGPIAKKVMEAVLKQ